MGSGASVLADEDAVRRMLIVRAYNRRDPGTTLQQQLLALADSSGNVSVAQIQSALNVAGQAWAEQAVAALLISLASIKVYQYYSPFVDPTDDQFSELAQCKCSFSEKVTSSAALLRLFLSR